jgi:hypothetical protein
MVKCMTTPVSYSVFIRCLKSNTVFVIYTNNAAETGALFEFKEQDWVGTFVVLLNPEYHCDFGKKKQMAVHISEMLLPIPSNKFDQLATANKLLHEARFNRERPSLGGNAFNVRVKEILIPKILKSVRDACGNKYCNGRHCSETPCALFPSNFSEKKKEIITYKADILLPEHEQLGTVEISCASFAKLFCTEDFLSVPSNLRQTNLVATTDLANKALAFYKSKGYEFEIAGLGYGRLPEGDSKKEDGTSSGADKSTEAPLLTHVRAHHFLVKAGTDVFANKLKPVQVQPAQLGQRPPPAHLRPVPQLAPLGQGPPPS